MKNLYKIEKATLSLILIFFAGSFLPDCSLHAQQLVDTLNWSTTSASPVLATSQNNLYVANASYIGKGNGNSAFFLNGSSQPEEGMPIFSGNYSNCNGGLVMAAVQDGKGGWYVGGNFAAANGEKTGQIAHILPDKSIEQPFINGLSFSPYGEETVYVLKKNGDFLYVGGTFSATDNSGNTYKGLFRVNLATKTVDPTFNPISLKNKYIEPGIEQIEVSTDKVFISGASLADDNDVSFLVCDKRTGKRIAAPSTGIANIKLLGNDTLLYSANSPTGYPAQKLAILDTTSDTSLIKNRSIILSYPFIASVADGKGGWFVAGDAGIFHYDQKFQKDDAFSQNNLTNGYYFLTKQLVLSGSNLFVVYDAQRDINGKSISQVFKLDALTGAIDTSFSLQPDGKVYSIAAKGDTLFVSGTFNNIAGNAQPRLAAVSCSTGKFIDWHPVINICNSSYDGIGVMLIHNNLLYAGGKFKISGTPDMASVARFDLNTGIVDTSFHFNALLKNCGSTNITGMALYHNKLFLAGYFSLGLSNEQIKNLVYINLDDKTIHPVNRSFATSTHYSGESPKLAEYNGKIYCHGVSVTDTATLLSRKYLFAFDAESGHLTQWNPNPDNQVFTFSVSEGRFFISGYFTVLKTLFINNKTSKSLAALNTHTFQYIPIHNHGKVLTGSINSFSYNDKYIFAGCNGMTYGDSTINGILRLNRNGLGFSSFHPHLMAGVNPSTIYKIALGINGLYVLGTTETAFQKTVRLVDPETGEVKKWHPALSDSPTEKMLVSGNNVILSTYYGSLWPAFKREKLGKIDLSTGQLSQWTLDAQGNGHVQKMTMSGDTIFVLFDVPVILNRQDTGVFFPIDNITGHVIPGFKSPTIPPGSAWGFSTPNAVSFARQGSHIFIIGDFDKVNGKPYPGVVKINLKTGNPEQWFPPITEPYFASIVTYRDTVYLSGSQIQVKNDQNYYFLISVDANTGKIIRKYHGAYASEYIGAMAVNKSGKIALLQGGDYYGYQKAFLLPTQNRDTLIEINKIEEAGNHFTVVKPAGNLFLFALNNIKEKGKVTSKPGFITYDPQLDTVFNAFGIPVIGKDKGIRSFAFTDKILAIGGDFCGVYGNPKIKNLAFLTMPDLHLKPGITSWAPNKANNLNPFAVRIYGTGFGSSTSVSLSNGKKTMATDSLIVQSNKVIAWFDGTNFSVGNWDLTVKINDTLSKSYPQAFHITQGSHADVWAKWTGPKVVLVHKPETYYITVGNSGNTGAYGVYLYIATGLNQTVEYPNYIKRPHVQYKNFTIDMDTVTPYSVVDYFMGQPFHGKVYSLFIPYIPADFESGFSIHIRSDVHGETPEMVMAVSPPLYESFDEMNQNLKSTEGMFWSFFHCVYDIGSVVAKLAPGVGCAKSVFDNFIVAGYDKYKAGQAWEVSDITKSAGLVGLDCAGGSDVKLAYEISAKLVQVGTGLQSISQSCDNFFKRLTGNHTHAQTKVSVDPNGKFGPAGMNASQYVPTGHPFQYLITYENDSAATAPAQRVIIIDTLDKNVFDLNTFHPLGFGFGDTTYMYQKNDGDTLYIDLRPAKNAIVRVFYKLNTNTGILQWVFQTLDPDTYEYVTNVNDGFLPPNKKAPEGDGNILYSISPLPGLADGTEIKNTAHIVFDWNAGIPTKAWVNQTDDTPPESAVNTLPDKEVNKGFTVSWGGSDDGSGIYAYTVFVSENDSAYYPWITETHDTSAVFSGQPGVTYKFYSVATDSAGNVEAAPGIYDAMTQVSGTGIETFGTGNQLQFRLFPNPAKGKLHMDAYLPQSGKVRIDILNVCGHLVIDPIESNGTQGILKNDVDLSRLPAGTYFVRISTRFGSQIRKVVIQ